MAWRKRLNEHFPGGGGTLSRGLSVRGVGDRGVAEDPPVSYPDVAPAIGATLTLDDPYVEGTLEIVRASDGFTYVEGVAFDEVLPDQWTNLTIPPGTGIVIDYLIETGSDIGSGGGGGGSGGGGEATVYIPRGVYESSATYYKDDLVHYNNITWLALANNLTGIAPTAGANWMLFADRGPIGLKGDIGGVKYDTLVKYGL